jgi:S-disulfanyl-L-cysteine oxidoreductase SoxD
MSDKSKVKLIPVFLSVVVILLIGGVIFYLSLPVNKAEANITLKHEDGAIVDLGRTVYAENCASCHGVALEGHANWRQRDAAGYLPAPPHDETGHTWHHPDSYLFLMTKYGIEEIIGKSYPNNMPAYEDKLVDGDIIAVLSYIKSTWPDRIQRKHDQLNARVNVQ